MIDRKTWEEFRESGLLWWANQLLHTFEWAIVVEVNEDREITDSYPARVKFRGFDNENNTEGYIKVSNFMRDNAEELLKESKE